MISHMISHVAFFHFIVQALIIELNRNANPIVLNLQNRPVISNIERQCISKF
jgi:hypothetical protein